MKTQSSLILRSQIGLQLGINRYFSRFSHLISKVDSLKDDRGDVPGWVLVVLMTTGLLTGIWTVAAPRLSSILTHSLDNMNNIR